jgi:D-glycero-alpha-D-manno-heptose-7-phosphate kinase
MSVFDQNTPQRLINATAPIRMCDLGGWSDTWFAEYGAVLNIGVYPYAEVQIETRHTPPGAERAIEIHVENYGESFVIEGESIAYDHHPLLQASLDIMDLPADLSFKVNIFSHAPAGCSTGTSASVSVALIAGLDLLTPGRHTSHEIATLAHRVETEKLGLQCGIQDQLAAAYGGVSFIEMFKYPHASVSQLQIPNGLWWELERRLVLVFLGKSHTSSEVHGQVIERLDSPGADKSDLETLREAAHEGKNALLHSDLDAFGRAMTKNTVGQMQLHPSLVSDAAQEVISVAKHYDCLGWKVNGAGGDGGSLSLLCDADSAKKRALVQAIHDANPAYQVIPTYLARMGIRRWEQPVPSV